MRTPSLRYLTPALLAGGLVLGSSAMGFAASTGAPGPAGIDGHTVSGHALPTRMAARDAGAADALHDLGAARRALHGDRTVLAGHDLERAETALLNLGQVQPLIHMPGQVAAAPAGATTASAAGPKPASIAGGTDEIIAARQALARNDAAGTGRHIRAAQSDLRQGGDHRFEKDDGSISPLPAPSPEPDHK